MKILEITINPMMAVPGDPLRLRVGEIPVTDGHVVEKINFHPSYKVFNNANEVEGSCYAVYFENIPERRIVMASMVTSVEAVKEVTKKSDNSEAAVELPE